MNERELRSLTFGFRGARAVMAAVRLGLVDQLAEGPMDAEELALACGTDPRATGVLATALLALGILEERDGRFDLCAAARAGLARDGERTRRNLVLHDLWHWGLWSRLDDCVRDGAPVSDRSHDPFFTDPEVLGSFFPNFAEAMAQGGRREAAGLAKSLSLSGDERILDLGGGRGDFAIRLAGAHPGCRVELVELPPVASEAQRAVAEAGLADRIEVRAGDFTSDALDPKGTGFDVVLLARVLMGLEDEAAAALLARCREVLRPGGRVAVLEFRRDGPTERVAALLALDMLLLHRGSLRDASELRELCGRAGLRVAAEHPVGEWGWIVEATE